MGTIAQAYESGGQKANEGLFSNLVTLSRVDGVVAEEEVALLERVARKLSLTAEQAKEIINHPEDFPMIPPVEKQERFERLIQFIEMTFIDGVVDASEANLIGKYGIALGFTNDDAKAHSENILNMFKEGKKGTEILEAVL